MKVFLLEQIREINDYMAARDEYTPYNVFTLKEADSLLRPREKFSHKGTYGHSLLIAGSYGMAGAAVLSARATMRAGAGLLTAHIPEELYDIMQISVPEVMCRVEEPEFERYDAIGIGPGIGLSVRSENIMERLLTETPERVVLDADALNIISQRGWQERLPEGAILTPHIKEFDRLTGYSGDTHGRVICQREFSKRYKVVLLLKGAFTSVTNPEGELWFNTTGNPGMATAGSGDVLTGVILGLLSQGYGAFDAARLGAFLHGLAGDIACEYFGENSLMAGDIIDFLPDAFGKL